jgi:ribonucleoside-triphosphate reductase
MTKDVDKLSDGELKTLLLKFKTRNVFRSRIEVEEIQDIVEELLMESGKTKLAKAYIIYRYIHAEKRSGNDIISRIKTLIDGINTELNEENSNKNSFINSVQRDYMAGEISKEITKEILPDDIYRAWKDGLLHFHDSDYFAQYMTNCCLIPLNDMFENHTVISGTLIETPHAFSTSCTIATQIIAQVASSQYGGQSISLAHLAPYVDASRRKFRDFILSIYGEMGEKENKLLDKLVQYEISKGVQTIQYQVQTLLTTNGQAPFLTLFMWINEVPEGQTRDDLALLIEEVLKQRILGVKNEKGVHVSPAFPKLIYVTDENNIYPDTKYWHLTELACKCTAKRLVPDYISAKKMAEYKEGNVFPVMGCRSNLSPWKDKDGNYKFYGRFNQGVVTINLVDVACSSNKDMVKFWEIFDERLELCHRALLCRHERLKGTSTKVATILWQYGTYGRLSKDDVIDELLYDGYSTISLGYAGLAECVYYMTGKSHTTEEAKPFALSIMEHMNDMCEKWKNEHEHHLAFSIYGTPLESTTYSFAKALKKRFGIIEGVTDKDYITNSYHIKVTEEIDAFSKLAIEAEFQHLSIGGAISYIEVPNMQNNIEAIEAVVQFMYENVMYAELNTKSDYCQVCGYDGEIQICEDDNGKLIWECPNCGNRDQSKMNVARRSCGYIGTQFWNQGRTQEIRERVLHL